MSHTILGLSFNVARSSETLSGYQPSFLSPDGLPLYGSLRLQGFAAAFKAGFADRIVLFGGTEVFSDGYRIARPQAIKEMLVHDLLIPEEVIDTCESSPNSKGNVAAIEAYLLDPARDGRDTYSVVTNHYHIPRVHWELHNAGLVNIGLMPAEAILIFAVLKKGVDAENARDLLLPQWIGSNGFFEGYDQGQVLPYLERVWMECKGIAQLHHGSYQAGTK